MECEQKHDMGTLISRTFNDIVTWFDSLIAKRGPTARLAAGLPAERSKSRKQLIQPTKEETRLSNVEQDFDIQVINVDKHLNSRWEEFNKQLFMAKKRSNDTRQNSETHPVGKKTRY